MVSELLYFRLSSLTATQKTRLQSKSLSHSYRPLAFQAGLLTELLDPPYRRGFGSHLDYDRPSSSVNESMAQTGQESQRDRIEMPGCKALSSLENDCHMYCRNLMKKPLVLQPQYSRIPIQNPMLNQRGFFIKFLRYRLVGVRQKVRSRPPLESYKLFEPRQGEPTQTNKA